MESLSQCLFQLSSNGDFNYLPRYEKLAITHLMFVVYLLLLARTDAPTPSVQLLFEAFNKFSKASGLAANLDKSEFYFGGIGEEEKSSLQEILGMVRGTIPFKYLGAPLSSKKLSIAQCNPLVEKVTAKINA